MSYIIIQTLTRYMCDTCTKMNTRDTHGICVSVIIMHSCFANLSKTTPENDLFVSFMVCFLAPYGFSLYNINHRGSWKGQRINYGTVIYQNYIRVTMWCTFMRSQFFSHHNAGRCLWCIITEIFLIWLKRRIKSIKNVHRHMLIYMYVQSLVCRTGKLAFNNVTGKLLFMQPVPQWTASNNPIFNIDICLWLLLSLFEEER